VDEEEDPQEAVVEDAAVPTKVADAAVEITNPVSERSQSIKDYAQP
jgi:CO/xanthine dehydrogenase FAD-binding subunit